MACTFHSTAPQSMAGILLLFQFSLVWILSTNGQLQQDRFPTLFAGQFQTPRFVARPQVMTGFIRPIRQQQLVGAPSQQVQKVVVPVRVANGQMDPNRLPQNVQMQLMQQQQRQQQQMLAQMQQQKLRQEQQRQQQMQQQINNHQPRLPPTSMMGSLNSLQGGNSQINSPDQFISNSIRPQQQQQGQQQQFIPHQQMPNGVLRQQHALDQQQFLQQQPQQGPQNQQFQQPQQQQQFQQGPQNQQQFQQGPQNQQQFQQGQQNQQQFQQNLPNQQELQQGSQNQQQFRFAQQQQEFMPQQQQNFQRFPQQQQEQQNFQQFPQQQFPMQQQQQQPNNLFNNGFAQNEQMLRQQQFIQQQQQNQQFQQQQQPNFIPFNNQGANMPFTQFNNFPQQQQQQNGVNNAQRPNIEFGGFVPLTSSNSSIDITNDISQPTFIIPLTASSTMAAITEDDIQEMAHSSKQIGFTSASIPDVTIGINNLDIASSTAMPEVSTSAMPFKTSIFTKAVPISSDKPRKVKVGCEGGLGFCDVNDNYPKNRVAFLTAKCRDLISKMFVPLPDTFEENSNVSASVRQDEACSSEKRFLKPGFAVDDHGKWQVIIQTAEISQRVIIEMCRTPQHSCSGLTDTRSRCVQKFSFQLLMALDPEQPDDCPAMRAVRVPTSCTCQIEAPRIVV